MLVSLCQKAFDEGVWGMSSYIKTLIFHEDISVVQRWSIAQEISEADSTMQT